MGTILTVALWAIGAFFALLVVMFIWFARDYLRMAKRTRHRWVLAVGLPARVATLNRSSRHKKMNAPDPELSLAICNFDDDKDWLREQLSAPNTGSSDVGAKHTHFAWKRIRARLQGCTARSLAESPMQGYQIRDAIAWDAAMLVEEARRATTLGWIKEVDVWGVLFLNARRIQDTFESWRDFSDAALRGREYELRIDTGKHASPAMRTALEGLHANTQSSFSKLAWDDELVLSLADFT